THFTNNQKDSDDQSHSCDKSKAPQPARRIISLCFRLARPYPFHAIRATLFLPMVHPNFPTRSEEHTSELQSRENLVCRLLLEKKKAEPHPHTDRAAHP